MGIRTCHLLILLECLLPTVTTAAAATRKKERESLPAAIDAAGENKSLPAAPVAVTGTGT